MKNCVLTLSIFLNFIVLFTNCKSNQTEEAHKLKQDSLLKAATTQTTNSAYSKYIISPPGPDYTGDYVDKYPNGVVKFTGFFRFGQRHGQWMAFYENGIKWSDCFYDNGKKHGATIVYHPNGSVLYNGWYKNDLRDSIWYWFDDKGKEIDRRAFKDDVETGLVN
jgi:antitoxin component YwqK of YwqJK toxin-antitoxin module